ncbi:glycoside hydrolase family 10 protein [Yersinia pestis]|uniref:Lipoprotein n=9 Tax=Yersinia pestis TaxID=632 RepID=A0AAX2I241_YERPE|nr:glycoside hydrolase family 10 protein [Yersinia pestis]EDR33011.1 putative lipoprotein [Yersinia pestis biovar Orientalis str. IP275]EFA49465.1 putative lipoprotein [Yersinia pestis KIM D27]ERP72521.1 hypothetical protein L328_12645 [Yersinia pestis 24H]AAM85218.1 hypothetical protein y1649 [Yersinia pestis KIM10+]AAS62554.1 putative lipoprotein [Yersinia pestis biovar Microtus str. 91001]
MLLHLKGSHRFISLMLCALLLAGCGHQRMPEKPVSPVGKEEPVRGVWLTTVLRLDWPSLSSINASSDSIRISTQKKELTDTLDDLVKNGVNTLFFQVKPDGSALYHSAILPWSDVLTGVTGKDPGYDPLAFAVSEAHKRGLKIHAWLNPYRVSMDTRPETSASLERTLSSSPASVYALHKDWIRTANGRFVLDPGLPEVRHWITNIVAELVKNYDIDGIQFDDYFYYETPSSRLDDDATYQKYGQSFSDKANWRRNNTLLLIKQVSSTVRSLKPEIEFGVSPAGVWRNQADDPLGSETQAGSPSYDTAYADTRLWVQDGLLDYIAPQLYWTHSQKKVKYDTLATWWADTVRHSHTKLYIGVALYKVGQPSQAESDWALEGGVPELKRQLDLNDALPEISGTILFREAFLRQPQTEEAVKYLKSRWRN